MARAHLRYTVKDRNGNIVQNAAVYVYPAGNDNLSNRHVVRPFGRWCVVQPAERQSARSSWRQSNRRLGRDPGGSQRLAGCHLSWEIEASLKENLNHVRVKL